MPTSDIKLKLIALLPQLGSSGVEILLPFLTELRAEKGHVLVKQGDKDEDMYFLLNGVFFRFRKNTNQSVRRGIAYCDVSRPRDPR